jgi:4-azaleucine resistance transporter AzlC
MTVPAPLLEVHAGRRRLLQDAAGITLSVVGFALVYGLAARSADFSLVEAMAMSLIVFAGASQFAAVGYLAAGMPWLPIVVLTFLLNLRHALYSASLAPLVRDVPLATRAGMAHVLTDEAFALSAAHFQRIGRVDIPGYWIAAVLLIFIPWNLASIAGLLLGGAIPDPTVVGLDVVFPAAMAGLAAGLVTGRRELVAAGAGAAIGVVASIAIGTEVGVIAGGLLGPLIAMGVPDGGPRVVGESEMTGQAVDLDEAMDELAALGDTPSDRPGPGT